MHVCRHSTPHAFVGLDGEAAGTHQVEGRAVAHATAREAAPRLDDSVLKRREEPRARAHVLDEQQLTVGA
jgi:hypothetical protein